ncbi:MAG: protein kinase [Chlamydiia bacterium]|nr:protein kinase [Chlamydiia bacterium]
MNLEVFESLCHLEGYYGVNFEFFDISEAFVTSKGVYRIERSEQRIRSIYDSHLRNSFFLPVIGVNKIINFNWDGYKLNCYKLTLTDNGILANRIVTLHSDDVGSIVHDRDTDNLVISEFSPKDGSFNLDGNFHFTEKIHINSKNEDIYFAKKKAAIVGAFFTFPAWGLPLLTSSVVAVAGKVAWDSLNENEERFEEFFYNPSVSAISPSQVFLKYSISPHEADKEKKSKCDVDVQIYNNSRKIIFNTSFRNTGLIKKVQFYDCQNKVMLLFAESVILFQKSSWLEKKLPRPCIDGRFMSNNETLISQINDVTFQILELSKWHEPLEVNIQTLTDMSQASKVHIVGIHPTKSLIALGFPNVLRIFEIHLDQVGIHPGPTIDAAAAASSETLAPLMSSCTSVAHHTFQDISALRRERLAMSNNSKIYTVVRNDETVVFKGFPSCSNTQNAQTIENEASIYRLDHPNLVRFIGFARTARRIGFLLEYHPKNLVQLYTDHELNDSERKNVLYGICAGAHHLHTQNPPILHQNIKGANVLIDAECNARLTDFRYCQILGTNATEDISRYSPKWCAPECWQNNDLSLAMDIYSIGMTLLEITTIGNHFRGKTIQQIHSMKTQGHIPSLPKEDDVFEAFYQRCCATEPNDRYQSAEEARQAVECILVP